MTDLAAGAVIAWPVMLVCCLALGAYVSLGVYSLLVCGMLYKAGKG
jgi:hypothetical protein